MSPVELQQLVDAHHEPLPALAWRVEDIPGRVRSRRRRRGAGTALALAAAAAVVAIVVDLGPS